MITENSSNENETTKAKVIRAKPVAKSLENNASAQTKTKGEGVHLAKKIQTAEGWKREQKKLRDKK